ncbi:DUF805 domain-containing protein [Agromyces silvae]|uniref:DUF805 domain-containing protein n=1 Tax=Agromyces silvae TaxID=3388266 RepID=UPI00280B6304|nr:DUF805 domain-containing protein [Agromyces protaetiae]
MTAQNTYAQSDDLSQPLYGATFGQAIGRFFKKYATFSGRASRSEFWWWFLMNVIVSVAISIISAFGGGAVSINPATGSFAFNSDNWISTSLSGLWFLATVVPWLALAWRRLHDSNKPGPFWFLGLIPIVGPIILLVFFLLPSDPAGARFDR